MFVSLLTPDKTRENVPRPPKGRCADQRASLYTKTPAATLRQALPLTCLYFDSQTICTCRPGCAEEAERAWVPRIRGIAPEPRTSARKLPESRKHPAHQALSADERFQRGQAVEVRKAGAARTARFRRLRSKRPRSAYRCEPWRQTQPRTRRLCERARARPADSATLPKNRSHPP